MFRAFDPDSDRLVAVKVFTTDLAPERVHQIVAEFERLVAVRLSHPSIAAPLAAGISGNRPYLVQEYVSADSLDVALRHGPASPQDAVRAAAQLASALDFAAVDDILHGALHPRDVLTTPENTRMTGLGVARAFEVAGVPPPIRRPYTAPECIAGRSWDRRADVFSLAAVMHELIWGRRLSAMGAQAADGLTGLEGGNLEALREVFAKALAEEPEARFETAIEFADALKHAFPETELKSPGRKQAAPRNVVEFEPRLPLEEPEPDLLEPALPPTPLEIVLRQEPERFADVEREAVEAVGAVERLDPPEPPEPVEPVEPVPAALLPPADVSPRALEQGRSDVWPLALALVVGAAIGFGGGYFFANYERVTAPETVAATETAAPAEAAAPVVEPPAKEFTENTVAETPAVQPAAADAGAAGGAGATPTPTPTMTTAAAAAGKLAIRSTPSGARVFVDGREAGRTPLTIDALDRGVHRVRVVREGYATEERRVTITASRPSQAITVPLSRARAAESPRPASAGTAPASAGAASGALTVITRPAGASVFIDDTLVGRTPLQVPSVATGARRVRLELDGYRRWSTSVNISAGENRVTASLER